MLSTVHGDGRKASDTDHLDALRDYPFLRASLEDLEAAYCYASTERPNMRHVVCLMFDALEFLLYEILLLHEKDIYRTGQNTIGFDEALKICRELQFEIPLIGTVRDVQKHRGDAKHHAQSPDGAAFLRMLGKFRIIVSRLIHEQFEGPLADTLPRLPLVSHHVALFECYRLRRNNNWQQALKYVLGALLQKHREMFGKNCNRAFPAALQVECLVSVLKAEIEGTEYAVASASAIEAMTGLPETIEPMLDSGNWEGAAKAVGTAYSTIDELVPGIFDVAKAEKLTDKLYVPRNFRFGKPMAWSKFWAGKDSEEGELAKAIQVHLREHGGTVEKLGEPHYADDDDRIWRWWELALFDGERWHSFHLNTSFEVSLETGIDASIDRSVSTNLLRQILVELRLIEELVGAGG